MSLLEKYEQKVMQKIALPFKKILLTGINGQVGHALQQKLAQQADIILFGLGRAQLDLTNVDQIRRVVSEIKPDLIINPAAYTAVDKAESEPELAFAINATAARALAEEASKLNALLVHYSTDYVFDGNKSGAYNETDATNPLGVYGQSKLAGEQAIIAVSAAHLIFRTSWVYGTYGKNFFNTILRLAAERDNLQIVADQFGAPTSSKSIADATMAVLNNWDDKQADVNGIYHMVNAGRTSWHGFATEIVTQYSQLTQGDGLTVFNAGFGSSQKLKVNSDNINPISTAQYPTPAARPINSSLDCAKLQAMFNTQLPAWQLALADVLASLDKPQCLPI